MYNELYNIKNKEYNKFVSYNNKKPKNINPINFKRQVNKSNKILNDNQIIYANIIVNKKMKYLKLTYNQLLVLDGLMNMGGYKKKYIANNKKVYSEHSGLLDFDNSGLERIIISGKFERIEKGDNDIFLPVNMIDAPDFEYIFHTHPPTPKPGGRVSEGVLYDFPSISDVFHYIDHHNKGKTQGSLIIASEGLYNLRNLNFTLKEINVDENKLYKEYIKTFNSIQNDAIEEYGETFTDEFFFSEISQNTSYIDRLNKILNKFNIHIDFFKRVYKHDNWVLDSIHLPIYVVDIK